MAGPAKLTSREGRDWDCAVRLRRPTLPDTGFRTAAILQAPLPLPAGVAGPVPRPRRRPIRDHADALHCSIIGTCPAAGELLRLLRKLGRPDASDHER